jgi:hypothetical protein
VATFPICDGDIRRRFVEISPTDKLLDSDFYNASEPVTLVVVYTPEVVGPHLVKTKVVVCIQDSNGQSLACQLTRQTGYYDTDPESYILAGNDVDPDTAKKVVRLWMQGKLVADQVDWLRVLRPLDSRLYTLNYALHGIYTLDFRSSGCSGPVYVKIEGVGDAESLRVIRPPEVICE